MILKKEIPKTKKRKKKWKENTHNSQLGPKIRDLGKRKKHKKRQNLYLNIQSMDIKL